MATLLEKISSALNKKGIDYAVIGGQAVLVYGYARFTNDIDLLVAADATKLSIISEICLELNLTRLKDDEFTRMTNVVPIFDPDTNFRADLVFCFSEFEREAIERAVTKVQAGVPVKFAAVEDLILMKLYASRAVDIEDIKKLLILNSDIDMVYIKKWLVRFDMDPELELSRKLSEILNSIK